MTTDEKRMRAQIDTAKIERMTDKQILKASLPKLPYYATMGKTARRSCLWCDWSTANRNYLEPIREIETHYMEQHA